MPGDMVFSASGETVTWPSCGMKRLPPFDHLILPSRAFFGANRCRLFSPDIEAYSTSGQSCPDASKYRSLALLHGNRCRADRRDSVPWAATNISHAAHFGPRTLLEIRHACRRSRSGAVVRIRSRHQLLDGDFVDGDSAADLCICNWHRLCLLAREIREFVGSCHWT